MRQINCHLTRMIIITPTVIKYSILSLQIKKLPCFNQYSKISVSANNLTLISITLMLQQMRQINCHFASDDNYYTNRQSIVFSVCVRDKHQPNAQTKKPVWIIFQTPVSNQEPIAKSEPNFKTSTERWDPILLLSWIEIFWNNLEL